MGGDAAQGRLGWDDAAAPTDQAPCLRSAHPDAWPVAPDWSGVVSEFWVGKTGAALQRYLQERLNQSAVIYPPEPLRALALTALKDVKVVILGQDPYHGPGQAEGLAFSVAPGVKPPPSLRNIFKEQQRDLGLAPPANGSLVRWAVQGVLLINACLTVEDGQAGSHAGKGWEELTDAIVRLCSEEGSSKAFLLWGAHAQKKANLIDGNRHLVLTANHPSPLSANRPPAPFLGCGHFGAVNEWLEQRKNENIRW
jgi:uracil-DNA glycosylase